MEGKYYHAGCGNEDNDVRWSTSTRRTHAAAVREAQSMAMRYGGRPIVEWWDRKHGLRPGDCNLVEGAEWIEVKS